MTKTSPLISAAIIGSICFPYIIQAQEATPQIIVTANRTSNTVDETIAPVTILTRDDIERLQASSVTDVLATTPGLDISQNGGFGSTTNVYMRGTNSNQVLVLIDGVPSGSATLGTTSFQYLPISQVERIEVVRGPHSSLYGSSAIGGVIQIFTRKEYQGRSLTADVGYGSEDTSQMNLSYSNGDSKTGYHLGLGYQDSDGYNFLGNTPPDDDDDGFDNTSMSLGGYHQLTEQLKLSGTFLHSEGTSEFDGYDYKDTHTDYKQQVASLMAEYKVNDIWTTHFQLGQSKDDLKNKLTASQKSRFKTTKDTFIWKNELLVRETDLLTMGLDYLDEGVDSTTNYQEENRWNRAVFAQYQYYGDVFDIKASFRYDDNEAFGSHNTGNLTIGFDLDQYVRVTTSYGTAFKAPTFNSLYWPVESFPSFFYTYQGNPDLKPEESESFEFGLSGQFNSVSWTANYYQTSVSNLITNQGQLNPTTFFWEEQPENIGKAHINGIELTLKTEIMNWLVQGNISHNSAKDADTGNVLPNRSEDLFRLDMDRSFGQLSIGASVIAASERFTSSDDRIPGYGIMNLRGAWQLNSHWAIKAKVDNVFDKEYYTTQSFTGIPFYAQDRFAFVSLHYDM